ncbi:MAG TPA: metallophosphoesterase family protein [Streptosporangiaceae bacterium]|nr:metallophosphoesterase family protein [Streptosporangiaceae bacterium]
MQDCCGLSRRQLIQLASAGAAAGLVTPLVAATPAVASSGRTGGNGLYAQDLELVTVTDTSFVLTWYTAGVPTPAVPYLPAPAPEPIATDGLVRYGTDPNNLDRVAVEWGGETPYHYVEITGLRPGTTYYYQALSGGIPATPRLLPQLSFPEGGLLIPEGSTDGQLAALLAGLVSGAMRSASPGQVTTLVPPPGRLLFTLALSNDLHAGETVSGLVTSAFPPGFSQAPELPPYPVVMARAMTRDAAARGADVLLVAGDLTAAGRPGEFVASKAALDRFGTLTLSGWLGSGDYVVARGSNDQVGAVQEHTDCRPAGPGRPGNREHHDCLSAVYDLAPGRLTSTEVAGLRLIGLDTSASGAPGPAIGDDQFTALAEALAADPSQPTLVFGHHPVTDESALTTIGGPGFGVGRTDAVRLQRLYAGAPGVFLHHSGHTHRNLRTHSPDAPDVEFLEVAATKEYPGGFALLKVYAGGYMVNFFKSSSDLARQWSQVSSGQYLGLYPAYTLGTTADRNHVVRRDFSALSALRHRPWWGQRPRSLRPDAATA